MLLINCENNLTLAIASLVVSSTKFKITDTKVYVLVVTLSTQENAKLLGQLKWSFKTTITWNKYETKVSTEGVNQYLDFLIDPSFQGVNRVFVLSFENEGDRKAKTRYFLPKVEMKNYNILIDGNNFSD